MYWTVVAIPEPCPCGLIHDRNGCEDAANRDRAAWRERQAAREAAQGFRLVNVATLELVPKRPKRELDSSACMIQATVGDFWENMR